LVGLFGTGYAMRSAFATAHSRDGYLDMKN
jgi:hypothetical protein